MKCAIHSVQKHQAQYLLEPAKWLNGIITTKHNENYGVKITSKLDFLNLVENNKIDFVISGARSSSSSIYCAPAVAASVSQLCKMIWVWHSFLIEKSAHNFIKPQFLGQYSVLPEYFKSVLGVKHKKGMFYYKGHYLSAFHLTNPPKHKQKDHVLVLPLIGSTITEIENMISHLDMPYKIRFHPGEYIANNIGRSIESRIGMEIFYSAFGDKIIDRNEPLLKSIDESNCVLANYESSLLIEALVRGRLYDTNRKVAVSKRDKIVYERAGIKITKNAETKKDFGYANETIINQCCVDLPILKDRFTSGIMACIASTKIKKKERRKIKNKFYYGNIS